jgi:hypothetical protein
MSSLKSWRTFIFYLSISVVSALEIYLLGCGIPPITKSLSKSSFVINAVSPNP